MAQRTDAPGTVDGAAAPGQAAGEQPLPGARLVPLGLVRRDSRQPRKWFNPDTLRELAASIRQQGLLQPVTVRPDGRGRYLVVLGERRFRAAQAAGLAHLPVLVREIDDETSLVAALIENLQRDNLTDDEQAEAFRALRQRGWSTRRIGRELGLTPGTVSRLLRVFGDELLGDAVTSGVLTKSQAQELLVLPVDERRRLIAELGQRRRAGAPLGLAELRAAVGDARRRDDRREATGAAAGPGAVLHNASGAVPGGGLPEPLTAGLAGAAGGSERARWLAWDRAARLRRHTADELAALGPYLQDATVRAYLDAARQLLAQALAT